MTEQMKAELPVYLASVQRQGKRNSYPRIAWPQLFLVHSWLHQNIFRMHHFKNIKMPHFKIAHYALKSLYVLCYSIYNLWNNHYICWNNGAIYRNNELKHWEQKNRIMSNFISIIGWGLMESVLDCLYTYSSPFSMKLYLEIS